MDQGDFGNFVYEDNSLFPDEDNSLVWPWLAQAEEVPHPDDFLSIPRGPMIHEGFIPDDSFIEEDIPDRLSEEPGIDSLRNGSDEDMEDVLDQLPIDRTEDDPDFDVDEADAEGDRDDDGMSGDEAFEDDDAGPFARTRRRRGGGRGPRIYNTSRGRYGRRMGRGGRGIKRGPRQPLEPSQEFIVVQNAATDAFIDERNYDKALELIQKAISINPEVYSAHSLLSEIYFALDDEEKAIAALLTGAHALPKEPSVWHQIADVCLQRVSEKNRQQALQSAGYCYARLLQIDQKDQDARFQRAAISRQLGSYVKALKDLQRLLIDLPNNPSVLRQMAEVYTDMKQPQRARELYERSIAYHQSVDDRESFTFSDVNVYVELFHYSKEHARGIAVLKSLSRWLLGRISEVFWDAVQDDDREWDLDDEPRRVQVPQYKPQAQPIEAYGIGLPLELRVKLGIFRLRLGPDHFPEALRHLSWLQPETDGVEDYADLYREAADTLKKVGLIKEALRLYEALATISAYSDVDFLIAIGSCSLECDKLDEAIQYYERVKITDTANVEARLKLSRIYNRKGLAEKSKENAKEAIAIGRENLIRPSRRRYERREQREQRERAERELKAAHNLKVARIKTVPRNQDPNVPIWRDGTSKQALFIDDEKPSRSQKRRQKEDVPKPDKVTEDMAPSAKEAAEEHRKRYIQSRYMALFEFQDEARAGSTEAQEEWLDVADDMIRDFRSNRVLFPVERHVQFEGFDSDARRRASRKLHQKTADNQAAQHTPQDGEAAQSIETVAEESKEIPTEYCEISFSIWLDIFLEYSIFLARMGREHKEQCYATLEAATDCTVWYHSPSSMLNIHTVWFTCALALKDGDTMNNLALRWFMKEYQFVTDVYSLFMSLNLIHQQDGYKQSRNADYRTGPNQKFLFRQLRANDFHLPLDYNTGDKARDDAGPVPAFMRDLAKNNDEIKASITYKDPSTGQPLAPEEMDVALLVLYGQILYAANSFPNALNYFYRAYALNKRHAVVCLCIALSYIHQSLKRQSENRHMMIMQGMAFFQEYVDCRLSEANATFREDEAKREVEYNRARIWQLLGLSHLAVEGYWRILEGKEDSVTIKSEAALALQFIYGLSGDARKARDVTEKWLVIE